MKQKTLTIKPILGNISQRRILYWVLMYRGKVLHNSSSIYNDAEQVTYYQEMKTKAKELGATHIKNWITDNIEKID